MRWKLAALCAVVVLLGACSETPDRYGSASDLARALRAEGGTCDGFSADEAAELLKDQGTCTYEGSNIAIYIFRTEADRERWLRVGAGLPGVVVGPNWVVAAGGRADEVAAALDGRVP